MPQFTVSQVNPREVWRSKYATGTDPDMQDYAVQFREYHGWVKLTQKISTPAPREGEVLNGTISQDNQGNPKFKKDQAPGFASSSSQGSGSNRSDRSEITWGQAMIAAAQLAGSIEQVHAYAQQIYNYKPEAPKPPVQTSIDQPPVANYDHLTDDSPVNLDEIPF